VIRRTHYQVLGVSRSAPPSEIAAAYRRALFHCHPDLFPGDATKVAEFKAVTAAFAALKSPDSRRDYDWWLTHQHGQIGRSRDAA
jgi:DnaJ-class molecular chaperone